MRIAKEQYARSKTTGFVSQIAILFVVSFFFFHCCSFFSSVEFFSRTLKIIPGKVRTTTSTVPRSAEGFRRWIRTRSAGKLGNRDRYGRATRYRIVTSYPVCFCIIHELYAGIVRTLYTSYSWHVPKFTLCLCAW